MKRPYKDFTVHVMYIHSYMPFPPLTGVDKSLLKRMYVYVQYQEYINTLDGTLS